MKQGGLDKYQMKMREERRRIEEMEREKKEAREANEARRAEKESLFLEADLKPMDDVRNSVNDDDI